MTHRTAHRVRIRAIAPRASRRKRVLAVVGVALAVLLLPAMHRPPLRLVWNVSPSVPVGLYRIDRAGDPRPGDLVALRPSPGLARLMAERYYVEAGALLLKPVAASAGATVCRHGAVVTIDGVAVATARERDRFGRPLPRWSGCRLLNADELFLLAPESPDSFDGRYFGPAARSNVVGRAVALWTRP